jgi:hypothetical protein
MELGVGSAGTINPATNYGIVSVARQKIRATNHQATRVKRPAPARALSTQVNLLGRQFGLFAVRSHADEFLWNIKG